jgi:hypothetical protein
VVARECIWAPAIALGIIVPFLLLPDGRLRSRRWLVVLAAAVAGVALFLGGAVLTPGQLSSGPVPVENPFGLAGTAGAAARLVTSVGLFLYAVSLPAALLCLVLRLRAARGTERQQLRWVAAGATVAVLLLVPIPGLSALPALSTLLGVLSVPASVAVAVLRTVTYALLTGLLALPYLLILPATSRLAAGSGSLAVAAATLAAAALFQPLRRRVQQLVDRRFNRRRYDAGRAVEGFATRLREQVDLQALSAELLAVVDQTVEPSRSSLWLRPAAGSQPATCGTRTR